jgi:hypothetical protein
MPSGQNFVLGLIATITLEVVHFRAYALLPALLSFFKCILEVVFRTRGKETIRKTKI